MGLKLIEKPLRDMTSREIYVLAQAEQSPDLFEVSFNHTTKVYTVFRRRKNESSEAQANPRENCRRLQS